MSGLDIINCTTPTGNAAHAHCPRPDHHFWAEINCIFKPAGGPLFCYVSGALY